MGKRSGVAGVPAKIFQSKPASGNKKTGAEKSVAGVKGSAQQKINRIVENVMLDEIRSALVAPDKNGVPYFKKYVQKFLQTAIDDPESVCSRQLSSGVFNESLMKKLDSEANAAIEKERDFTIYRLRQQLFGKQQEVFDDDTSRRMIIICSRRSGKTELNARKLIKACLTNDTPCIYTNITTSNAIQQMFDLVVDSAAIIGLVPDKGTSKADGVIHFSNGSSIKFTGLSDIAAIEKVRGFRFRLAIVDEIQSPKNMKYFIDQVLTPATADYADSQIIFSGTPPRTPNYATMLWNSNIKKYTWTMMDNPYIPNAEQFIKDVCKDRGITVDDPFIQREYFGVVGAWDRESQVYKNYKTYKDLPSDLHLDKIMIGCDFGFVDYNAIVSIMVDNLHKKAYIYRCSKFNHAGAEAVIDSIQAAFAEAQSQFIERGLDDRGKVIVVTDTNEPHITFDLQKKYGIPAEKAYKYDKITGINELATGLRTRVFIQEDLTDIKDECEATVWKRDESDNIIPEIDDDTYHPDAMDAILYAFINFSQRWGKNEDPVISKPEEPQKSTKSDAIEQLSHSTLPPWMQKQSSVQSLGGMQL